MRGHVAYFRSTGSLGRNRRAGAAVGAALLLAGLGLGGCSISLSDLPGGGPNDTARNDTEAFPAVNDLPTGRGEDTAMAPAERSKIESELIAARDRQAALAAASAAPPAATK